MPKPLSVSVNTHGHCFDGLASAVVFTTLLRTVRAGEALAFSYRSCGYGPKMASIPADWLKADINAILDFRYTESDRLTYYFDHHVTGFASPAEEARARETVARSKRTPRARSLYYDAKYGSCTKLIRDVARDELGVSLSELGELVEWADRIDAARFDTAEQALGDTPAQRIAQIVEQQGDAAFLTKLVSELGTRSLEEVSESPAMRAFYAPIEAAKAEYERRVLAHATVMDDVVLVDLADEVVTANGKFLTYALFPKSIYSVTILRTAQLLKVGVGYNPWSGQPRQHDISALCKGEGGGGHPVVGATSFPLDALEQARACAMRLCRALAS